MKIIKRACKYKLQPNEYDIEFLNQCFGHTRFLYNYFLNYRSESYEKHNLKINYKDTSKILTQMKKSEQYAWLKDIPSIPLQQSLRNLEDAFQRFFKKQAKYPQFKKRNKQQSATFLTSGNTKVVDNCIVISQHSKKYIIPFIKHRDFNFENASRFTISKNAMGEYFVSILVENVVEELPKNNKIVGIDLGLKDFIIDSDNNKVKPLKSLNNNLRKLRKLNKSLSRKKQNSNNFKKAKFKLSKLHNKIANQRKDFLHKLSFEIIHENQVIGLETLKVKNMIKNKRLSRHIADAGWGMFVDFLRYKSQWYGRALVQHDTYFPSSKLCHQCGHKHDALTLSDRSWQCLNCLTIHDRDHNAAINLKLETERKIATDKDLKELKSLLEHSDSKYCGEVISQKSFLLQTSMKQDAHSKSIDLV
jgi:putative transposase